jgi:hypothetical protein
MSGVPIVQGPHQRPALVTTRDFGRTAIADDQIHSVRPTRQTRRASLDRPWHPSCSHRDSMAPESVTAHPPRRTYRTRLPAGRVAPLVSAGSTPMAWTKTSSPPSQPPRPSRTIPMPDTAAGRAPRGLLKQPEAERIQADDDQVNCHVHDRDLPHAPVGDGCEIGESRDREDEETRDAPSDAVYRAISFQIGPLHPKRWMRSAMIANTRGRSGCRRACDNRMAPDAGRCWHWFSPLCSRQQHTCQQLIPRREAAP